MPKRWTEKEKSDAATLFEAHGRDFEVIAKKLNLLHGRNRSARGVQDRLTLKRNKRPRVQAVSRPSGQKISQSGIVLPREPIPFPNGRVLVYGDLHYCFQDDKAIDLMLEVAGDFQPDMIVIDGDLIDNWSTSHFNKLKPDLNTLKKELKAAKGHLARVRSEHPKARIIFIPANHEVRIHKYIAKSARELLPLVYDDAGIEETGPLSIARLLELERFGIQIAESVNGESDIDINGKLLVGHWHKISKHSAYSAKLLIEELGGSLIQAHTHRLGSHYRTWVRREVVGFENGCLCDLNCTYKKHPNWQQGFSLVTFVRGFFHIQQAEIVRADNHIFTIFGEKMYERRIAS